VPLSSAEQVKVVQLLGYGAKVVQAGSVIYDKVMNDRLASMLPEEETLTRQYLAQIAVLEGIINAAPARLAASAIDGLKMNHEEIGQLRSERRKQAKELATVLDIPYIMPGGRNVGLTV
jgi:hypothetical protein